MPALYDIHGRTLSHQDGSTKAIHPDDMLAFEESDAGRKFRANNPGRTTLIRRSKKDYRNSLAYDAGKITDRVLGGENMTGLGRLMEYGPWVGGGLGAVGGGLLGLLGSGAAKMLGLNADTSTITALGALGGAGIGSLSGYLRSTATKPNVGDYEAQERINSKNRVMNTIGDIEKSAAMYQDPRNFILEKLQSDMNVDFGAKASLAAKVRNLSYQDADKLAKLVRQAAGIGVGALIAKFVFGTGTFGTALGGLVGLAAYNMYNNYASNNQGPLNIIPGGYPYSYNNLMR